MPGCEFMLMDLVTVFKGPLLERLVYLHPPIDRETEAQSRTGGEGLGPEESEVQLGKTSQVFYSQSRAHFPRARSKGDLDGLVCQHQQESLTTFFWLWRSSPVRETLSEAGFCWPRAVEPQRVGISRLQN